MFRAGGTYVITSHGLLVAKITPYTQRDRVTAAARNVLFDRLRRQRVTRIRRWTRDELYEAEAIAAIDTNVLVYAEGINGAANKKVALEVLERLTPESTLVPVQVLGELFNVLVKKAGRRPANAWPVVLAWGDAFPLIETSPAILLAAMNLAVNHQLGLWDWLIPSAAADAGCRLLLSEDLQDGFTWGGVTVGESLRRCSASAARGAPSRILIGLARQPPALTACCWRAPRRPARRLPAPA